MWHKDSECQTWLSFTLSLTWSSYDNSRQGATQDQPPDDQVTTRCRRPQWAARSSPTNTDTNLLHKQTPNTLKDWQSSSPWIETAKTNYLKWLRYVFFLFIISVHMWLWKTVRQRQLFRWFNSSKQIKWWLDYLTQTTYLNRQISHWWTLSSNVSCSLEVTKMLKQLAMWQTNIQSAAKKLAGPSWHQKTSQTEITRT